MKRGSINMRPKEPKARNPLCAECGKAEYKKKEWYLCRKNCVLHAVTDGCMNPAWFVPRVVPPHKGELEYGSILPDGTDWRLRKFDAGMGETEYRIFKNEKFFARFDNRIDADTVMVAMTCDIPAAISPLKTVLEKFGHLDKCLSDPGWCDGGDGSAIYGIAGELWRAIKEATGGAP